MGAFAFCVVLGIVCAGACSANDSVGQKNNGGSGGGGGGAGDAASLTCGFCTLKDWTPCVNGTEPGPKEQCPIICAPGLGCAECVPGQTVCVGNEVHKCGPDGKGTTELVEVCDVNAGQLCGNGKCGTACEIAEESASNVGCEFWAVDLDQVDGFNDPASAPWGVALSNASATPSNVTIEINNAPPGQPIQTTIAAQVTIAPGDLEVVSLPTRELDCGVKPNDYASPGTCLSSNAYRISSSAPIVVYQFNVFQNAYSNDASLLLPTNALGKIHRIINWGAGHPVAIALPGLPTIIDRSYVTIVGTKPGTQVTVKPSWRIKGNPPIAATPAGGNITATLGPFDVLNLETDDATIQDDPKTMADLTSTIVTSSAPVAVFSGVETTAAPGGAVDVPTPPGWEEGSTCCLDHLEEQIMPVESVGKSYILTRSPVRSTGSWKEPDVLRFMGVAEPTTLTTTLAAPYDNFTLQPGEVVTTWTQEDVVVSATAPVMIGQILVSNEYVDGQYIGDPSLTVFSPVEQYRSEYVVLTPPSWTQNWVVIAAEVGTNVLLDSAATTGCKKQVAGTLDGKLFESRHCPLAEGVHQLSGDKPFGIITYGYGAAGSYAVVGGADVKKIYEPPPIL